MTSNPRSPQRRFAVAAIVLAGHATAQDQDLIAEGSRLFQRKICATCHQVAGGPPALAGIAMQAPRFEGDFWGKQREVTLGYGGELSTAIFDEAYFIESIRNPMAKVVKSSAAPMPPPPKVSDEEMVALMAYVRSLSSAEDAKKDLKVSKGALRDFRYAIYNGTWNKLPNFGELEPVQTGEAESGIADTNLSEQRDNFGIVIEGNLEITEAAEYVFDLGSDDGSRLFVNGKKVVDNDGLHGVKNVQGSVDLQPGVVAIRIEYFEKGGGEHLSVSMTGPSSKVQLARNTAPQKKDKSELVTGNPIVPPSGEASIYRNFIKGASPRGIGVGYPEGVNICFDANAMNIVMAWHGAFMDGARHWNGRGQGFQPPSGHYLMSLPRVQAVARLANRSAAWPPLSTAPNDDDRAKGLRFRGYRLGEGRRPVFRYGAGDAVIEDTVIPIGGQLPAFTRVLTVRGGDSLYYLAAADERIVRRGKSFDVGSSLRLTLESSAQPFIREGADGQELLVPLGGDSQVRARYEWNLDGMQEGDK